jgi:hypothetical protein
MDRITYLSRNKADDLIAKLKEATERYDKAKKARG